MAVSLATARDAYVDNAGYRENDSVTEARAFATACRRLLVLQPQQADDSGMARGQWDVRLIKDALEDVLAWLATNNTNATGGCKHVSFEELRT